jgi:ABC-type nitrate/sulfonate/bicarbonate transport system ATPase subunit/ABC-type nitrate/sulfonate/bicarbonate transport system substrate-binding protein
VEGDALQPNVGTAGYLEIRDLVAGYEVNAQSLTVLDHIDLSAEPGEILAVVGPSGCGKSTLVHVIGGFLRAAAGSVSVDGEVVRGPSPDRGIVLQDLGLFPWRTVRQNIQTGLEAKHLNEPNQKSIVDDLLGRVRLAAFGEFYPTRLSGGMAQRVALARALAPKPKILLLDEPFGALDAQTRFEMQSLLLEMQLLERVTVIVVTHDVEEAIFLADRVVLLSARPARILQQFQIGIPRPRSYTTLTDRALVAAKAEILAALRGEILHASAQAHVAAVRPATKTLRIGFVPSADALPLLGAVRRLQSARGVAAVEVFEHDSGPALVSSAANGSLDLALAGACPVLVGIHQHLPITIVRDGGYLTRERHLAGLFVRSQLASLGDEELASYTIGINGFGTNAEFICRRLLPKAGRELRFRVMPVDQMFGELRTGRLEVAVLFPPHSVRALAMPGIVAKANILDMISPFQSSLVVMPAMSHDASPYLNLLLEAWDFMVEELRAGPIAATEIGQASAYLSLEAEESLPQWDGEISLHRLKALDAMICHVEAGWQGLEGMAFPVRRESVSRG